MSKVLASWSGMRKFLEEEMLAESLKGRIRYGCTSYKGMDDCKVFEICIDGNPVKRFSWETVNTYFINNGFKHNSEPFGKMEYWAEFWDLLDNTPISERTQYTDGEFCDALNEYRNQDVQKSISSENPLVMMFAILDRRIGKRTLLSIKPLMDSKSRWLRQFYELRIDAEHILQNCKGDLSMTHYMNLNASPFEKIKSGEKTIELRLYDEKRQAIAVDDSIVFTMTDDHSQQITVKVTALHIFKDFEELYAKLPLDKCGYNREELPAASYKDMEQYYSKEKQAKYGVVGIEIELVK